MKVMVSENNLISNHLELDCGFYWTPVSQKKLCKRTNENATTIEIYNVVCYTLESKSYVGIDLSNQWTRLQDQCQSISLPKTKTQHCPKQASVAWFCQNSPQQMNLLQLLKYKSQKQSKPGLYLLHFGMLQISNCYENKNCEIIDPEFLNLWNFIL